MKCLNIILSVHSPISDYLLKQKIELNLLTRVEGEEILVIINLEVRVEAQEPRQQVLWLWELVLQNVLVDQLIMLKII